MRTPTLEQMMAAAATETNCGSVDFGDHASPPEFFAAALRSRVEVRKAGSPHRGDPATAIKPKRRGDWLSQRAAAAEVGRAERTIRAAVRNGELRAYKDGKRTVRIEREALYEWMRSRPVRTWRSNRGEA
jgi:excisionase family DNA binding protein